MTEEQIRAIEVHRASHIECDGADTLTDCIAELIAEVRNLKECLEPGKASAIVNGMFQEARRLGLRTHGAIHALTLLVNRIERLQKPLAEQLGPTIALIERVVAKEQLSEVGDMALQLELDRLRSLIGGQK